MSRLEIGALLIFVLPPLLLFAAALFAQIGEGFDE